LAALGIVVALAAPLAQGAGRAKHVVIVVMDGLRPDDVTPATMPVLSKLAAGGTRFARHHPVFMSSTEVNATALATGMSPGRSGVMANKEFRPDVELLKAVDTQSPWHTWKGDLLSDGQWIRSATLPELARAAGLKTAVAITKPVGIMWDRKLKGRTAESPIVWEGKAIPSVTLDKIVPDLGPMPPYPDWKDYANLAQDRWTTRVLTEKLWADGVPALSVLWLHEPDHSEHGTGPGSKQVAAALLHSDDCLATVLAVLEQKKVRDVTDVLVVSDHGHSTVSRAVDVPDALRKAGFKAEGSFRPKSPPKAGNIMVVGLGGAVSLYVVDRDRAVIEKLVAYLQTTDWAGVILTRDGMEGTFKMSDVALETPGGPDVVVAFRWKDETPSHGRPGTIIADGMSKGQGMHGTLSRYDMNNTLIASGPDFKAGFVNELPSGNFDVAPTVARILGIDVKAAMEGRVLAEALVDGGAEARTGRPETKVAEASRALPEDKVWRQYLKVTTYGGRRYYDEGNAGAPPEAGPKP